MTDILKFTETPIIDESIEEYKYHEYDPITCTNLNFMVIAKSVDTSAIHVNKLIDGSRVNRPTASNAIAIQDLVKRLNG